ncbi:hypothetical protein B296_00030284 [Ensete ventricosum]|uniref:CRAL-TRIO domain-containing protein n=1 Tax=Ensete ventricosum TaxID=4639 RepID=A0A426Z5B5_ENSVE|nr:hypothetical protein B296_00030284 [Ensete ventricosum]
MAQGSHACFGLLEISGFVVYVLDKLCASSTSDRKQMKSCDIIPAFFFHAHKLLMAIIIYSMPGGQEKFVGIVDLQGWGYSNCDIRGYIAALDIMQVSLTIAATSPRIQIRMTFHTKDFLKIT